MKILVVYYSLEGSTRKIAERIAEKLSADLMEIHPVRDYPSRSGWKYVVGGFHSTMKIPCSLKPMEVDPHDYDLLVIGAPVWAYQPAPPVVTFFKQLGSYNKKVALFCTHGGSPRSALSSMSSYFPNEQIVGRIEFKTGKDQTAENITVADEWSQSILNSSLLSEKNS